MYEVACQIYLKKNGNVFLDPLKKELLNLILQCGNLTKSAKQLNISYQHAWNMVNEINAQAREPIVIKQRGGANGGGTEISVYGRTILREYAQIEKHINSLVEKINVELRL